MWKQGRAFTSVFSLSILPLTFHPSSVRIGFTQTEYTVMEGGTVDVTVSVMEGTPSGDVVVTVTSQGGNASMLQ